MNQEISLILVNKLVGLPFVQVLAGLVKTVTVQDPTGIENAMVTKRYPVATDTNINGKCSVTAEMMMIPNSKYESIIYFEDFGSTTGPNRGGYQSFTSTVRLVCWYNKNKLLADPKLNSNAVLIASIIKRLETHNPENHGQFTRLKTNAIRIPIQDASIFSRYTYTETDRQYLRPPFDFFAIDFNVNYEINPKCLQ